MAYSTIANSEIAVGAPITNSLMTKLRDNPEAIATAASGATKIVGGAIDWTTVIGDVGQTQVGASAIGQGELKTASTEIRVDGASGEVTTSSSAGRYAFAWESFEYSTNEADPVASHVAQGNNAHTFTTSGAAYETKPESGVSRDWWRQFTIENPGLSSSYDGAVRELYVQSSPPYDLGDGECGLFIYALINKNGEIMASSTAPDPCWALNGPTKITPDKFDRKTGKKYRKIAKFENGKVVTDYEEITQSVKMRDMNRLPHPFVSHNKDFTPVLIDPVCEIAHQLLDLHEYGDAKDKPHSLIKANHIIIDNSDSGLKGPQSILMPRIKWKNTGKK